MGSKRDNKMIALTYIKDQIITCEMQPGSPIQVDEIAEKLNISKTPVREALLELQYENYITIIPRKRTVVRKISLQELRDVYDARTLVEPYIIQELSAEDIQANMDLLTELNEAWSKIDIHSQSRESYSDFVKSDLEFHQKIVQMSSNECLINFCSELIYKSQRFWYMALFNNKLDVVQREHLDILRHLIDGDIASAVVCSKKHISISKALSILSE